MFTNVLMRLFLGGVFTVFGLNFFFQFFQLPPASPLAAELVQSMIKSGYLFQLVKVTEIVCGLLILSGFFVPLASLVLAPIVLNIFAFNLFLAPSWGSMIFSSLLVASLIVLAWQNIDAFRGVLAARNVFSSRSVFSARSERDRHQ